MSSKSINEWAREVHQLAVEKGWWPCAHQLCGEYNVNDAAAKLALVHSEISEALEEVRERPQSLHMRIASNGKPEGFDVELADAIIRILDLGAACGLDIEKAMEVKHAYNRDRAFKHGGKAL